MSAREHELGLLSERWEQCKEGSGQVVELCGEMGIGKSRLVQVFQKSLAVETYTRLKGYCSPYQRHRPLHPIVEPRQQWLQWQRANSPQGKLHCLEEVVSAAGLSLAQSVPLFVALCGLPHPSHYAALTLTPQQHTQQTFAALLSWLLQEAERQPVCLVLEDLHWADPDSLEFLRLLIDQVPMVPVLVLLTCRPEVALPGTGHSHVTQITLNRLPHRQAEQVIERVTAGKAFPPEVVQQLLARANGIPLFVEELTKMVLELGLVKEKDGRYELVEPPPLLTTPATLQDSLMARLDRQGMGKLVAQLEATLGREFAYEVLRAVVSLDETTLRQGLSKLVRAEILYQRGLPPQAQCVFTPILLQEAAYQSLLPQTRQQYHQRIAQVLEAHFPATCESEPALLAHHYTEAGRSSEALAYWHAAGQRAISRSAHTEAIAYMQQGLALAETLHETPERLQHELRLQIALGVALTVTQGFSAPAVEHAYLRARTCCEQVGNPEQPFTVLHGLWLAYLVRGELHTASSQREPLLQLSQQQQGPTLLLEAHHVSGTTLFFLGELAEAWTHMEQGILLYEAQQHRTLLMCYGLDLGLNASKMDVR